jgi:hypothetical protein
VQSSTPLGPDQVNVIIIIGGVYSARYPSPPISGCILDRSKEDATWEPLATFVNFDPSPGNLRPYELVVFIPDEFTHETEAVWKHLGPISQMAGFNSFS